MSNQLVKKLSLGMVSLLTVGLLAACGDTGTVDDPATEPLEDPVEDPADPTIEPEEGQEDESEQDMEGPGTDTP